MGAWEVGGIRRPGEKAPELTPEKTVFQCARAVLTKLTDWVA